MNISTTFEYTGGEQEFTVPSDGSYKIEVWGAEGGGSRLSGNSNSGTGGYGGYYRGTVQLKKGTKLYIHVGGHGQSSTSGLANGGYNGGGSGYASDYSEPANGGGGATDVRLVSGAWNSSAGLLSRIIVAGGGGGGGEDAGDQYGHGGGVNGVDGAGYCSNGTQTSAGTGGGFGYGGSTNYADGGGGGGGWYGGGTTSSSSVGADSEGGGGGSGYILTSSSTKPSGYTPTSDYYFTETSYGTGIQSGNGKCVITYEYEIDLTNKPMYNFDYTGNQQTFTAPYNGTYQLEVWGAEGGYRSSSASGGKGGYSCGQINLKKGDILYIYVGGNGNDGKGYNGGGQVDSIAIYGGGGTDIRKGGTALNNRIIVAGGGGSVGASYNPGGYGGGTTGGSASGGYGTGGGGGTQTAGGSGYSSYPNTIGSLGKGGNGRYASSGYGGAGGGGYYGGGGVYPDSSDDDDRGGGGGSGYVNNSVLFGTSTKAGNTSIPTTGTNLTGSTIGRSGHGSCRIILLTKDTTPVYINVNGTWKEAVVYINVNGTWKETTPQINVNGTWKNL